MIDDVRRAPVSPPPPPQVDHAPAVAKSAPQPDTKKSTPSGVQADRFDQAQVVAKRADQARFLGNGSSVVADRTADQKRQEGLKALGLDQKAFDKAAAKAKPELEKAGAAAAQGHVPQALEHLRNAATQGATDLAETGIKNVASKLPEGVGKRLLTDNNVVHQLVTHPDVHGALGKLATGNVSGGLRELAANKPLRDAALDVVAKEPGVQNGLKKLGFNGEDLKRAGDAAPDVLEAATQAAKGDFNGAINHLKNAGPVAQDLATRGIVNAAKNLPDTGAGGVAKSLLTDDKVVRQLVSDPKLHDSVGQILKGQVGDGLKGIASNQALRDASIDALSKNKDVKAGLDKLGLKPEDLKKSGDALPALVDAGTAAAQGHFGDALKSLGDAAGKASPLVEKGILTAAKNLPDTGAGGVAKSLLTDPGFVKQLVENKDAHQAVGQLAQGQVSAGLKSLAGNDALTGAAIDALGKNKDVKAGLDKLGLTTQDLKDNKAALPSLVDAGTAAAQGHFGDAIKSLGDAAAKAPSLVEKGIASAAKNLPDTGAGGVAKSLLTDKNFVKQLVENKDLHSALGDLAHGKVGDGLKALAGNPPVANAAIDVLSKNPSIKSGMDKLGLTADDLKGSTGALPELVQAGLDAHDGKYGDAVKDLVGAAGKAPALVEKGVIAAAKNLPDAGAGGIAKSVLTDPAAVKALVENKGLHDAVGKLAKGDLSALSDLAKNPGAGAVADAVLKNKDVKAGLDKLGLTPEDVKGSLSSLADVAQAAKSFTQQDFQGAFKHLQDAAKNLPKPLVEKAITTAAGHLPETGPAGMVRSLLTDKGLVKSFVEDKNLQGAFSKMLSGNFEQGLKDVLGNDKFRDAAAGALSKNQGLMKKLEPFGISNAQDLASAGKSAVDLLKAGESLAQGHLGDALKDVGSALKDAPASVRGKVLGSLTEKLHLPEWAKEAITGVGGALGDPAVGKALGEAIHDFQQGDVGGFAKNLAETGRQIAKNDPAAATALLDSLSHLPGSLGKLFADKDLNKALVDSHSLEHVFNGVEKLIGGHPGEAMGELGNALGSLLTQGKHFNVLGHDLPIGMDGLKNVTNLVGRFVDAMPQDLKEKIAKEAAKAGAKNFLESVPLLGNIVSGIDAIGSAKDLIKDLGKDKKDWLQITLDGAQTALDVGSMVPGLNDLAAPLRQVVGTVKIVKGAADLITNLRDFQKGLVGI